MRRPVAHLARLLVPVIAAAVLLPLAQPANAYTGTITSKSFTSGTFSGRTWLEYVSGTYTGASPVPVMIVLHGSGGGTAQNTCNKSTGIRPTQRWRDVADAEPGGMIVICPDAVRSLATTYQEWNDCRSDNTDIDHTIDDVGFISAVIANVVSRYNVNNKRIYATGISNGGMMSYRLAAELSQKIAGIAPMAANMPADPAHMCAAPTHPRTVVQVEGDQDPEMPWAGGNVSGKAAKGSVLSAAATQTYWEGIDGTTVSGPTTTYPDVSTTDGWDRGTLCSTHQDSRVQNEPNTGGTAYGTGTLTQAQVVLDHVTHAGHTIPDKTLSNAPDCLLVGDQNTDINAVDEAWAILKQYSL
jgi:polyhydroxybutyrate depolymerase